MSHKAVSAHNSPHTVQISLFHTMRKSYDSHSFLHIHFIITFSNSDIQVYTQAPPHWMGGRRMGFGAILCKLHGQPPELDTACSCRQFRYWLVLHHSVSVGWERMATRLDCIPSTCMPFIHWLHGNCGLLCTCQGKIVAKQPTMHPMFG